MSGLVVRKADAKWRRATLDGKKSGTSKSGKTTGRPAAVITAHDDGTFSLRLMRFDATALQAIKTVAKMTWDPVDRVWLIWNGDDRDAVLERLRPLGFRVALR